LPSFILQKQRSVEEQFEVMKHILVIDEDRVLVDLLREFLATEEFTVDVASDDATGLAGALDGEPNRSCLMSCFLVNRDWSF
jgi:DNA-binding NtrC family response regulator